MKIILKINKVVTIYVCIFFFLPVISKAQDVLVAPSCDSNLTGFGSFESDDLWRLTSSLADNLTRSSTYANGTNSLYSLKMLKSPDFRTNAYYTLSKYKKYHLKAKFFVPLNSTLNSTDNSEVSLKFLKENTSTWSLSPVAKYIVKNGIRGSWVDLFSRMEMLEESGRYSLGLNYIRTFTQGESYIDNLEFIEICSIHYTNVISHVTECNGSDGKIEISLFGGEKPYLSGQPAYSFKTMWSHNNAVLDNNKIIITGLKAGTYKVRIGDLNSANLTDTQFNNYVNGGYAREVTFIINEPQTIPPKVNNLNFTNNLCTTKFEADINNPQSCTLSYLWSFGDGSTSNEVSPFHSYSNLGNYNVSLQVNYDCQCASSGSTSFQKTLNKESSENIFQQLQIHIPSEEKKHVLSSSVTTFSDAWALHHNTPELANKEGFTNGTMGIWRNDASYVYEKERKQSINPDLKADGTYTLQQFNWEYADLEAVPNWIKLNTMTEYSPFSFELENKDVLGRYSAALYDYGGQLQSANGSNMKYQEMAFTSFETEDDKISGNWKLGDDPKPRIKRFKINTGFKNIVLVEGKLNEFDGIEEVEVLARSIGTLKFRNIKTKIVCRQVFKDNPDWTYLVFEREIIPSTFMGTVSIRNVLQSTPTALRDNAFAHSGNSSLKITADRTFKQELLSLGLGKKYLISAWVSVGDFHLVTPKLANNIGIDIIFKDKAGVVQSVTSFEPSGSIIEGWQQLKGTFTAPAGEHIMEIKFKPGSKGTAWYDDLRLHPEEGNMQSYVYDVKNFRLQAILDEENFASFYYYDQEGNLHLVKKETEQGVKTISESTSYKINRKN